MSDERLSEAELATVENWADHADAKARGKTGPEAARIMEINTGYVRRLVAEVRAARAEHSDLRETLRGLANGFTVEEMAHDHAMASADTGTAPQSRAVEPRCSYRFPDGKQCCRSEGHEPYTRHLSGQATADDCDCLTHREERECRAKMERAGLIPCSHPKALRYYDANNLEMCSRCERPVPPSYNYTTATVPQFDRWTAGADYALGRDVTTAAQGMAHGWTWDGKAGTFTVPQSDSGSVPCPHKHVSYVTGGPHDCNDCGRHWDTREAFFADLPDRPARPGPFPFAVSPGWDRTAAQEATVSDLVAAYHPHVGGWQ